jgi:hypothetical protein
MGTLPVSQETGMDLLPAAIANRASSAPSEKRKAPAPSQEWGPHLAFKKSLSS